MGNVLFAISAYIFMRAFEVLFSGAKDKAWYGWTIKAVACAVLYTSVASMIWFYSNRVWMLGFDPK